MQFRQIRAGNLFSLGSFVEIPLYNRGLVLITGSSDKGTSNGSGKSTISSKILIWALFGQTSSGVKGDSVINNNQPYSTAFADLDFNVGGKEYKIRRSRNPNKLTLTSVSDDYTQRHQSETQKIIESLIGKDFSTFLQTDFFGQGRNMSFLSLPPSQQSDILENILPFETIINSSEFASNSNKEILKLISAEEIEIKSLESALDEVCKIRDNNLNRKNQFNLEVTNRVDIINKKIKDLKDKHNLEVGESVQTEVILRELAKIEDNLKKLYFSLKSNRGTLGSLKEEKTSLEARKAELKGTLLNLGESNNCPTCNQEISNEMSQKIFVHQHEILMEISNLDMDLDNVSAKVEIFENKVETQEKEVEKLNETLSKLNKSKDQLYKIKEIASKIDNLNEEKSRILIQKCPYTEQIKENEKRIKQLEHNIVVSKSRVKNLSKDLEHIAFWKEAFSKDIRAFMLNKACSFLESRTDYHLNHLNNGHLKVKFNTTKELKSGDEKIGLSVTASSAAGGEGFSSLSGGEQQITSFAAGLALSDLAESQSKSQSNLMVLDEPFTYMDDANCENVVNYLTGELSKRKSTILLVSNEENLKSLIPTKISVHKSKGITNVKTIG